MTEEKFAFTMRLNAGMQAEYKRRHDAIWPALSQALTQAGVRDYSIHLDPETDILFAVLWRRTDHGLDALATTEIMQEWWAFMADIMHTHADNAPVTKPLETVFHMA
jgi:L-rhamnose mutarotase